MKHWRARVAPIAFAIVCLFAFAAGVFVAAASFAAVRDAHPAQYVGEEQTTYRAGDVIPYTTGCLALESLLEVVRAGSVEETNAAFDSKVRAGECFVIYNARGRLSAIPVELKQWMAGPFDAGGGATGSIWRGMDIDGDEVYLFVLDASGRHEAADGV